VKGSNRRAKARRLVARVHQRVTDARRDHLHKLSRRLVDENQVVIVEDLHVKGMVKNPTPAKAISDAGWGTLIRFIEYKCGREGKAFVRTNRWFPSSKACSACGHVRDTMGLDVRQWTCSHCGASHNRDINAARDIRDEGLRLLTVGTTAAASLGTISRRKKLASRSARPNEAGSSSRWGGECSPRLAIVAEEAGSHVIKLETKRAAPSQRCPRCGVRTKKELSDRVHVCMGSGHREQRDAASSRYMLGRV
jgi:putative transposase